MLTDKTIKALKPKASAYYEINNTPQRGYGRLAVKVNPSGEKYFYLLYRHNNKRKALPLGRYGDLTLKEAGELYGKYKGYVYDGIDPREVIEEETRRKDESKKEVERKHREEMRKGSIGQLIELYLERLEKNASASHFRESKRALLKDALPFLGTDTKAKDITPDNIVRVLHPIAARGKEVQCNRVRAYLSALFNYGIQFDRTTEAISKDIYFNIQFNPVAVVPKQLKREAPRDRVLTEAEIYALWQAIENSQLAPDRKITFKLLFATGGQRVREVIQAEWTEFSLDEGLWTLPSNRGKE